jgi:hypothetical protein
MPNGEERQAADVGRLIEILAIIMQVLRQLVTNRENRQIFVPESQEILARGWPEIEDLLQRAIGLLRQGIVNLDALRMAGLTDGMLAMKHALFMQSAQFFSPDKILAPGGSRRRRDELDRFMEKTNTIIKSLAVAFPFLEPVGEYKEMVHASMK